MSSVVSTLMVKLAADNSAFKRVFSESMGNVIDWKFGVVNAVEDVGKAMFKRFTIGLGVTGAAATKFSLDYEHSLSKVVALTDTTQKQVNSFRGEIEALSGETGRPLRELAEGLYFVRSSGIAAKDSMDVVRVSAKAAAAGLGETQDIASLVTSAMNAFGAENLNAAHASDVLAAAVAAGKAEAVDMAHTLGGVIPLASAIEVSFDEAAASVAAMTLQGQAAGEAVTATAQIMQAFLNPTSQAEKQLKKVGLTAKDVREAMGKDFLGTVRSLNDAMGGNVEKLNDIIGRREGMVGFLNLVAGDTAKVDDVFRQVVGTSGDLDKSFNKMAEDGLWNVKRNMNDVNRALTEGGKIIAPLVGLVIGFGGAMARAFTDAPTWIQAVLVTVLGLLAAMGPLIIVGAKAFKVWSSWRMMMALNALSNQLFNKSLVGLVRGATASGGIISRAGIMIRKAMAAVASGVAGALSTAGAYIIRFGATVHTVLTGLSARLAAASRQIVGPWAVAFAEMSIAAQALARNVLASTAQIGGALTGMGAKAQATATTWTTAARTMEGAAVKASIGMRALGAAAKAARVGLMFLQAFVVTNLITALFGANAAAQDLIQTLGGDLGTMGIEKAEERLAGFQKRLNDLVNQSGADWTSLKSWKNAVGEGVGFVFKGEKTATQTLQDAIKEAQAYADTANDQVGVTAELTKASGRYMEALAMEALARAKGVTSGSDYERIQRMITLRYETLQDVLARNKTGQDEFNGSIKDFIDKTKNAGETTKKWKDQMAGLAGLTNEEFKNVKREMIAAATDISSVFGEIMGNEEATGRDIEKAFMDRVQGLRDMSTLMPQLIARGLDPRAALELWKQGLQDPAQGAHIAKHLIEKPELVATINESVGIIKGMGPKLKGQLEDWKKYGRDAFTPMGESAHQAREASTNALNSLQRKVFRFARNVKDALTGIWDGLFGGFSSERIVQGINAAERSIRPDPMLLLRPSRAPRAPKAPEISGMHRFSGGGDTYNVDVDARHSRLNRDEIRGVVTDTLTEVSVQRNRPKRSRRREGS